jgi:hypothetical protein
MPTTTRVPAIVWPYRQINREDAEIAEKFPNSGDITARKTTDCAGTAAPQTGGLGCGTKKKGRVATLPFAAVESAAYFFVSSLLVSSFFFPSFFFSSFFFVSFLFISVFSSFVSAAKAIGVTVTAAKTAANSTDNSLLMIIPLGELNMVCKTTSTGSTVNAVNAAGFGKVDKSRRRAALPRGLG